LAALLKKTGLTQLGLIPESGILGKGVSKRLKHLKNTAHTDIMNLETKNMERWPAIPVDPVALVTATLADSRHGGKRALLSKSLQDIPTQHLLGTWEQLRKSIYGGDGATVRGLSLAPSLSTYALSRRELDPSTPLKRYVQPPSLLFDALAVERSKMTPNIPKNAQQKALEHDWFFRACGASSLVVQPISFMGNYAAYLATLECPRDPQLLDPPLDEDSANGVLRRKLEVNFGSPYKKFSRRKTAELDIDERTNFEDIRNIFADSPAPHRNVEDSAPKSGGDDSKLESGISTNENENHSKALTIPPLVPRKRKRSDSFEQHYDISLSPNNRGIVDSSLRKHSFVNDAPNSSVDSDDSIEKSSMSASSGYISSGTSSEAYSMA
jgi:hypothetical protein